MSPETGPTNSQATALTADFEDHLNTDLVGTVPERFGVAVSGGGDSVALLKLLRDWANDRACEIRVVTIDHGLREASASEAAGVARLCADLGLPHVTLNWSGWDGAGNLQQAARNARYRLMTDWANRHGIKDIALGHTLDDQAETLLMRLARGSGVDGLSAMSRSQESEGIRWRRPLLGIRRLDLRDYLRSHCVGWVDDPSNDDDRFDRVRTRKAMAVLETLSIDATKLSQTASRLQDARRVLEEHAAQAARDIASIRAGSVFVEMEKFRELPSETRRRLLAHALCWVSGNRFPPRAEALAELSRDLQNGETRTLHGCLIGRTKTQFFVTREARTLADATCKPTEVWASHWQIQGPDGSGDMIAALGENGLKSCPDWRTTDLPRAVLLVSPGVWRGDDLIAAPVAGWPQGWVARSLRDKNDFVSSLLSH